MNKFVLEVSQDPLLRDAEPILVALSRQELEPQAGDPPAIVAFHLHPLPHLIQKVVIAEEFKFEPVIFKHTLTVSNTSATVTLFSPIRASSLTFSVTSGKNGMVIDGVLMFSDAT